MPSTDTAPVTGDCFSAAANLAIIKMPFAQIVHGIVTGTGPLEGVRFAHAWVEHDGYVFDHSNGRELCLPQTMYYKVGQITEDGVNRYKPIQAQRMMLSSGHYGPWAEKFFADGID